MRRRLAFGSLARILARRIGRSSLSFPAFCWSPWVNICSSALDADFAPVATPVATAEPIALATFSEMFDVTCSETLVEVR